MSLFNKKASRIILLLSLLVIFSTVAMAYVTGPGETFVKLGRFIAQTFGAGDGVVATLRISLFILVFTIYYVASQFIPGVNNNIRIVLALILSIISVIAFPVVLLTAMSELYTTLVAVIVLGAPLVGLGALLYYLPGTNVMWSIIRISLVIFVWILLNVITKAVSGGI